MSRIKIKNIPKDKKVSKEEMKKITGGMLPVIMTDVTQQTGQDAMVPVFVTDVKPRLR